MRKIISCGEWNSNMIYLIVGGISKFVVNIILYLFPDGAALNKHPFMLGINAGLGMSLAFIPYILILKSSSKNAKPIKFTASETKYLEEYKNKNSPKIKKEKYLIIFLCAFLDFFQKCLVFMFSYSISNNIWIFNIVFLNIFTFMVCKIQIYKHQYFSSGIIILLGIILNIINLRNMKLSDLPILLLSMFIEIIYSLCIVLAKYGMDYRFCSPFEITFYEGFFALIMNILILIIVNNIPLPKDFKYNKLLKISEYEGKKYLDHFQSYLDEIDFTEVLLFIVTLAGRVLFNLFSHLTIKHFTSTHVVFLLIMGEFQLSYGDKKPWEVGVTISVFLIIFFMLLIFCEIIEINLCGLEKNTRKNILERERLAQIDDTRESRDSKEIWDGLELSSNSEMSSSINYNSRDDSNY